MDKIYNCTYPTQPIYHLHFHSIFCTIITSLLLLFIYRLCDSHGSWFSKSSIHSPDFIFLPCFLFTDFICFPTPQLSSRTCNTESLTTCRFTSSAWLLDMFQNFISVNWVNPGCSKSCYEVTAFYTSHQLTK